ncbi:uncharacterized protein METZ01_LOCUS503633, partial [marine metagenome]
MKEGDLSGFKGVGTIIGGILGLASGAFVAFQLSKVTDDEEIIALGVIVPLAFFIWAGGTAGEKIDKLLGRNKKNP